MMEGNHLKYLRVLSSPGNKRKMAATYCILLIILGSLTDTCVGFDILVIFPEPTKSHGILGDGYVRLLLEANHKVTYITPFPWKETPSNLTVVDISSNLAISGEYMDNVTAEYTDQDTFLQMLSYTMGRLVVTHPAVQAFLRKPGQKFDVVVAEWIDSEMYSSFAGYFSTQLIWAVSTQLHWQPLRLMDEVPNPSYSADVNSGHIPPLKFVWRLKELKTQVKKQWVLRQLLNKLESESTRLFTVVDSVANLPVALISDLWPLSAHPTSLPINTLRRKLVMELTTIGMHSESVSEFVWRNVWPQIGSVLIHKIHPLELELYDTVFKSAAMTTGKTLPAYSDIPKNYSMMLVNTHPSVATPWRVPPSVREIAGYHIKLPVPDLDVNLKSIMDASPQGVIYFSFGSTNSGKDMEDRMRKEYLELFRNINQTVLWKMEVPLENLPSNVHLMEWFPQISVLNHPNTKLFVTHGGLLSLIEAIHFGVPMITIPHGGDQYSNAEVAVKKGIAIRLENNQNAPAKMRGALTAMFTDRTYQDSMKRVSRIYHDRPALPTKELVHWVEHVITNKGALHLRSPALLTPLYQKAYLDLVALILAVIITAVLILYFSIRWCLRRMKQKCVECKR